MENQWFIMEIGSRIGRDTFGDMEQKIVIAK